MVLVLDGKSEKDAHVSSNLCYLICSRHSIRSWAVTNQIYFWGKTYFPSCVPNMLPYIISTMAVIHTAYIEFQNHYIPYYVYPLPLTYCPKSLGPFCIVSYYINFVKTSWTYSTKCSNFFLSQSTVQYYPDFHFWETAMKEFSVHFLFYHISRNDLPCLWISNRTMVPILEGKSNHGTYPWW